MASIHSGDILISRSLKELILVGGVGEMVKYPILGVRMCRQEPVSKMKTPQREEL